MTTCKTWWVAEKSMWETHVIAVIITAQSIERGGGSISDSSSGSGSQQRVGLRSAEWLLPICIFIADVLCSRNRGGRSGRSDSGSRRIACITCVRKTTSQSQDGRGGKFNTRGEGWWDGRALETASSGCN
jgi:hypothetical protein